VRNCWGEKKNKDNNLKKKNGNGKGKGTEELNTGEEQIAFPVEEELYNFDMFACNAGGNNEHLIFYDWLADSATTLHITHQWEAFTSYTPLGSSSITGVGGKEVPIAGQGTFKLVSTCNGQEFILLLQNVLYVPGTQNNHISLGWWDAAGGCYVRGKGAITSISQNG
jgi:hypothetical protein